MKPNPVEAPEIDVTLEEESLSITLRRLGWAPWSPDPASLRIELPNRPYTLDALLEAFFAGESSVTTADGKEHWLEIPMPPRLDLSASAKESPVVMDVVLARSPFTGLVAAEEVTGWNQWLSHDDPITTLSIPEPEDPEQSEQIWVDLPSDYTGPGYGTMVTGRTGIASVRDLVAKLDAFADLFENHDDLHWSEFIGKWGGPPAAMYRDAWTAMGKLRQRSTGLAGVAARACRVLLEGLGRYCRFGDGQAVEAIRRAIDADDRVALWGALAVLNHLTKVTLAARGDGARALDRCRRALLLAHFHERLFDRWRWSSGPRRSPLGAISMSAVDLAYATSADVDTCDWDDPDRSHRSLGGVISRGSARSATEVIAQVAEAARGPRRSAR